jgi:hypothetical protein
MLILLICGLLLILTLLSISVYVAFHVFELQVSHVMVVL